MGKATPTAAQRRLVALWRESTLSKAAFARAHRVHPGTFCSWVARHDLAPPALPAPFAFVEVKTPPADASPDGFVVHINDQALSFDAPPPPAWFAAVLRELWPC